MKNTGIEYEILVQSIFQEIHDQEAVKNVSVQRDVALVGKSGVEHQIDVFWEFEHADIKYQTVVQAKDWKSYVKKEQTLTFKAVLDDLPGQPRGVIVTKAGYQSGAKTFAGSHGIELFELKEEGEEVNLTFDRIFKLKFGSFANMTVNLVDQCLDVAHYHVEFLAVKIHLAEKWKKRKVQTVGISALEEAMNPLPDINTMLFNTKYNPVESISEVLLEMSRSVQEKARTAVAEKEVFLRSVKHRFSTPRYFASGSKFLPYVRIESVSSEMKVTLTETYRIPFVRTGITNFILKNIISGTEKKIGIPTSKLRGRVGK